MRCVWIGLVLGLVGLMGLGCPGEGGRKEWVPPKHEPVNPLRFDGQAVPLDEQIFDQGLIAGDPAPGSMLLWTHANRSDGLRLKVWLPNIDPDDPQLVDLLFDQAVVPDDLGYVHQRVDGLVPGTWHVYGFFDEAQAGSPVGRSHLGGFTVPPPEGALVRLTVSGTHGTHHHELPFPHLSANVAFEPFSLYFHLGDAIYSDSTREPVTPAACSLDEYLAYWTTNWRSQGFRDLFGQTVYLPVPDDHELANNYDSEFHDPQCPGRLTAGREAFFRANPWTRDPDQPDRLWRSWRWGDTLEVFALDTRGERKGSTSDDLTQDPPLRNPEATFIGPEQMSWLQEGLLDSKATFKLVLNSVPLIDFPDPPWLNMGRCDTWACYDAPRRVLIDFLVDNAVENVFFLSGDFHMALVGRLDSEGGSGHGLFEIFMGPAAQSNPLADREYVISQLGEDYDPLPPGQFPWGYPTPTMTYLDLDPISEPPRMTVRFYDPVDARELFRATFEAGQLLEGEQ